MQELAQKAPEIMQKAGAASAGASGAIAYIGNNASFFTAMGAIIGATVAVIGLVWQYRITKARRAEERELHRVRMASYRGGLE